MTTKNKVIVNYNTLNKNIGTVPLIYANTIVGAFNIQFPNKAEWPLGGITVVDISGAFGTNNLTILAGSNTTINGNSSIVRSTSYENVTYDFDLSGSNIGIVSNQTPPSGQLLTFGALTDGSTIAWAANTYQTTTVTLGGNRTLSNPTSPTNGQLYRLYVKQGSGAPYTLAFGTAYTNTNIIKLSTKAGYVDLIEFVYNSGTSKMVTINFTANVD